MKMKNVVDTHCRVRTLCSHPMRFIGKRRLVEFWTRRPDAEPWLKRFYQTVRMARWQSLEDVRAVYRHADAVRVRSGNTVTVFNVGGTGCRLIAAIHYDRQRFHAMMILTHEEYERGTWRSQL